MAGTIEGDKEVEDPRYLSLSFSFFRADDPDDESVYFVFFCGFFFFFSFPPSLVSSFLNILSLSPFSLTVGSGRRDDRDGGGGGVWILPPFSPIPPLLGWYDRNGTMRMTVEPRVFHRDPSPVCLYMLYTTHKLLKNGDPPPFFPFFGSFFFPFSPPLFARTANS